MIFVRKDIFCEPIARKIAAGFADGCTNLIFKRRPRDDLNLNGGAASARMSRFTTRGVIKFDVNALDVFLVLSAQMKIHAVRHVRFNVAP